MCFHKTFVGETQANRDIDEFQRKDVDAQNDKCMKQSQQNYR